MTLLPESIAANRHLAYAFFILSIFWMQLGVVFADNALQGQQATAHAAIFMFASGFFAFRLHKIRAGNSVSPQSPPS